MAYGSGNLVTAADFNAIAADVNAAYADTNAGSTVEASANYGYGQTPAVAPVATGNSITAAQWTALFGAVNSCAAHQGTTITTPASVSVGALIDARAPFNALLTDVTNIRANRLNASAGQTTITSGGAFGTSSRSTSWSGTVVHVFDVVFTNWDKARHFFNSGGQIRLAASRSGGSASSQNTSITNMLSSMGTIIFDHTATTRTGAGGTATSIGFYNLTSSYQTLFSITGTGVYTSDSYVLSAQLVGTPGSTGTIRFRASFTQTADGSVDALPDGTLTSNVDTRRATGVLTITAPTYTLNTALTSTGGGLPVPIITSFPSSTTTSITMNVQDTGSSPLPTSYLLRYRRAGSSTWINGGSTAYAGVTTPITRAGLTSNTAYEFQVAAVSGLGTSDYSSSAYQATPASGSTVSFTITAGSQPSVFPMVFDDTGYANAAFAPPGYGSVSVGSVNGKPIYAMWQTGVASSTVAFGSSGGDPASTFFRTIRIRAQGTTGTNAERTMYANQATYSLTPGSYATWAVNSSAENSFIMFNGQVYDVTVEY